MINKLPLATRMDETYYADKCLNMMVHMKVSDYFKNNDQELKELMKLPGTKEFNIKESSPFCYLAACWSTQTMKRATNDERYEIENKAINLLIEPMKYSNFFHDYFNFTINGFVKVLSKYGVIKEDSEDNMFLYKSMLKRWPYETVNGIFKIVDSVSDKTKRRELFIAIMQELLMNVMDYEDIIQEERP